MDYINESLWVAIAFVLFILLIRKKAGAAIAAVFDRRRDEVSRTLNEARALRDEAEAELRKYRRRAREAEAEAAAMQKDAKEAAAAIRRDMEESAARAIARKQEQAEAKIKALEDEVKAELRARAATLATEAAADIIAARLDKKAANAIIKQDIAQLRKTG